MNFQRAQITSGGTSIAGFKQDDQFLNVEPITDYLAFTWINTDGNQQSKFWLNWDRDFPLELISISGGDRNSIGNWECYLSLPNNPNFILWTSSFINQNGNQSQMPFQFPSGILLHPNSKSGIFLNNATSWLQILTKPASPISQSSLSPI